MNTELLDRLENIIKERIGMELTEGELRAAISIFFVDKESFPLKLDDERTQKRIAELNLLNISREELNKHFLILKIGNKN